MIKKHIKKRFRIEFKLDEIQEEQLNKVFEIVSWAESPKIKPPKGQVCLMQTDGGNYIGAFPYASPNGNRWIPEPDPILIYFHSAYVNYRHIETKRKEILKVLSTNSLTEAILNDLYDYFSLASSFVMLLFTSIEAFLNKSIPEGFEYKNATPKNTEIYSKEQIQRHLSFDTKIKMVSNEVFQKDFKSHYPLRYQHIENLKQFRDLLVHPKADNSGHTPYDYLYKKALDFKYSETLNVVADFFNFYTPGFVEECPCQHDW